MGAHEEACCICLEHPSKGNPIYLLACGCRSAWFHQECQNKWVSSYETRLVSFVCPTCRRHVPVETTYCISYYAGPDQQALWHSGAAILCEALIACGIWKAHILPFQSASLLFIPYILPSTQLYPFYITHLRLKYSLQALVSCIWMYEKESVIPLVIFVGYWYSFVLHLFTIIAYMKGGPSSIYTDVFLPFAISRTVIHIASIEDCSQSLERE